MAAFEIITAIRRGIVLLALVIFLGNIMMWIMMPTDTYGGHWWRHIDAHTNSTFFGIQGSEMLLFTFPFLFIAVLGCIYVYLGKRKASFTTSNKNDAKLRLLRKPMIVKGLGIVTTTELTLFALFVALCVWYSAGYIRLLFKEAPLRSMTRHEKVWQTKLDRVALVTGLAGNLCLAFLFYPVTRESSILPMLGLTSEASIKYHIWLGHMAMALFTAHGFLYIVYWFFTHRLSEMLKWYEHEISNVAGEISLLCGLALWVTTYPTIRRRFFELFLYTHYLYILFIIFFIYHIGFGFSSIVVLPGFYLFLIDRYLRFLQSREKVRLVSSRVLPCATIELNFSKSQGLKYNPTSTIFINVPSISKLQWHPFTINSNSNLEPDTLSVMIKSEGSWTDKLYNVISSSSSIDHLQVSVEGPYGPTSTNFLRHDMLVMISGGSGVAPFIAIIKELIFIDSTLKCKTPKIILISAFKNSSYLSMLDLIIPTSYTSSNPSNLDLQIEAYITREKEHPEDRLDTTRTIWFKPGASDSHISPTLGPNSWLLLAAIISSSFIIYLVLVGIFTQYVVYPVNHNINYLYSYAKQASMNMLLVCFSIGVAASSAFLWTKRRNANEAKQIREMEELATTKSSFDHNSIELESLPLQSVIKSINVQYGERPNLKRILSEFKDSNVGVLVAGPKQMNEDVAAICSRRQANNLHFESISFTW